MKKVLSYILLILAFSAFTEKAGECETVAYLLDLTGNATINREGKQHKASKICSELQLGDKITLDKNSSALISYSDKTIRIKHPQTHKVMRHVQSKSNDDKEKVVVRGQKDEKLQRKWSKLVDPKALRVEPVSIVRKVDKIIILSPSVKTITHTPDILLENVENRKLIVSLYSFEGRGMKLLGAKETDLNSFKWPHGEWQPLEKGKYYQLRVLYKGDKNRINASSHSFSTFEENEINIFMQNTAAAHSELNNENARTITNLCQLFKNECFGDAYILTNSLLEEEPDNQFLQKMQKRCYSNLIKNND